VENDITYPPAFFYKMETINVLIIKMYCWSDALSRNKERAFVTDPGNSPILDFPWPKPGEIPKVPGDYLRPKGEEKDKVRAFIDKHEGPETDPLTEMIVQLAKD
jgi:hypothetical protein